MTVVLPVSADPSAVPQTRQQRGLWRRLPLKAKVGAVLLGVFVLAAIVGPMVTPYDPSFQNPSPGLSLHPPDAAHLLGTTQSGQDVLSQLLVGIRLTLELAFSVGVVATALSVMAGVSAAFLGGVWDELLSLATNVFLVIPALPLLIILLGYLPQKGQAATFVVLSVLGWPWGARVIRAQTLAIRGRDFVAASRETGERTWRILAFEIMPNEVSLIAASFVNTVLYAIGASAALAFIGLADLSSWSLGTMLYWAQSQQALQLGAWWWFAPPGLAVAFLGTALVLLNSGIDELGNPRLRAARSTSAAAWHRLRPTDPTPVLPATPPRSSRPGGLRHAFSRASLPGEREESGERPGRRAGHRVSGAAPDGDER
jgi:peptide/nickel transport system permease protein